VVRTGPGRLPAAAIAVLVGAGAASAEIWNVDPEGTGDAPTIQAAIDAAESGDTILLAPGLYRDEVTRSVKGGSTTAVAFLKRGVALVGEDPFTTFIDGEEHHHCLVGENLDEDTMLRGITLLHGDALDPSSAAGRSGGGLLLYESSPQLREIRFVGCNSLDGGGGLRVVEPYGDDPLRVHGCAFVYCWSAGRGGGAELVALDDADVTGNTFAGNFSEVHGGGIAVIGLEARIENNVWWLSCAHGTGGSIWCEDADVGVSCNVFWENIPEIDEEDLECEIPIGAGEGANVVADPRFCEVEAEDFSIHAQSPAAEKNSGGCGLVGAYGPKCGVGPRHAFRSSTALDPADAPGLRVRVSPNPASGEVQLAVTGEAAVDARLDVFDLQGRRVRCFEGAVGASPVWDGCDESGARVVAGVYFVRASAGRESALARVVVLRR